MKIIYSIIAIFMILLVVLIAIILAAAMVKNQKAFSPVGAERHIAATIWVEISITVCLAALLISLIIFKLQ